MDASNIIVRRATVEDAEAMSLFMDALADEGLDTISVQRFTADQEGEYLEKASNTERAFFIIAMDGPVTVGVLDLWAGQKPSDCHAGRLGLSVLS